MEVNMKARNLLIGAATATTMSVLVGSAPVRAGSDEPCGFIGVDVGAKAELLEQGYTPAALYAMGDRDSSAFGGSTMAVRLHADVDLAVRTMAEHPHLTPAELIRVATEACLARPLL